MKKQSLKYFAASTLLGLLLTAASSLAQGRLSLLNHNQASPVRSSQLTSPAPALNSTTSYTTFSYIDFPQSPYTYATGINSGAASSKILVVGEYGPEDESGFALELEGKKGMTYAFAPVVYPGSSDQAAFGVNDLEQIVGVYDTTSTMNGYEYSKGKFTSIIAPFAGAAYTEAFAINNSGDIVGTWYTSSFVSQAFLLRGGIYTSLSYPGAANTVGYGLNNHGDIVGYYEDASGNWHGFLLSGGTYTSIDVPAATLTYAEAINDSGDIVGGYCLTSECATNYDGGQGYLLSGGVFQTINVPGASATALLGINNNGVIAGSYSDSRGGPGGDYGISHSFIVFP